MYHQRETCSSGWNCPGHGDVGFQNIIFAVPYFPAVNKPPVLLPSQCVHPSDLIRCHRLREPPVVPKAPGVSGVAEGGTRAWEVSGEVSLFPSPARSHAPGRGSSGPSLPLPCLCSGHQRDKQTQCPLRPRPALPSALLCA